MAQGKVFQSSHLERVDDYNSDTGELILEFTNGTKYSYSGIPFSVYSRLRRASQPGSFFHANIRGKYQYAKLPS